jgi:tetratricopeptide (TPR) repeat protein
MRTVCVWLSLLVAFPGGLQAQLTDVDLRERIRSAQAEDADVVALLQGANAAGSLRDFEQTEALLERAEGAVGGVVNAFVNTRILYELGSGGGINGAQRAFREVGRNVVMDPLDVAGWVNTYPELLVGGAYDDVIERLSAAAADPMYRCACYAQKAWMYRVAGDMERSRIYWDSVAVQAERNPPAEETATFRAQRVRNLARAGRVGEARQVMQRALATDRLEELPQAVQRNWAQAYAELGETDRTIEILERLLAMPSQVTVRTLETRVTWDPIRDQPAFQALLARHRRATP